ncbi:MAG: hypothetical protein ABIJ41_08145 [Candidatus Omnitrophota bacterium]
MMTPRKTDYQARKDKILSIVVDEYAKNVTPVSSGFIVKRHFYDLSPATIRNILAELEEDGYLTHPHTSAGRIPTQKGYRYFVDHLMNEIQLLGKEKKRIEQEYLAHVKELERLLEITSQAISELTQYTSLVSLDGDSEHLYCSGMNFVAGFPEFHDFQKIQGILRLIEQKEHLLDIINRNLEKRIEFFIGNEIACEDMGSCSLAVSKYQRKSGETGRIALLGPTRMDYERVVSALEYLSELMSQF